MGSSMQLASAIGVLLFWEMACSTRLAAALLHSRKRLIWPVCPDPTLNSLCSELRGNYAG